MKNIMTIHESDDKYMTSANSMTLAISKDAAIYVNGIKLHPRMTAIKLLASLANIQEWVLVNN